MCDKTEICNNNIDDNGDGKIDCTDIDCIENEVSCSPYATYLFDPPNFLVEESGDWKNMINYGVSSVSDNIKGRVVELKGNFNSYAVLDPELLNGRNDFSISFWIIAKESNRDGIISAAGDSLSNEFLIWTDSDCYLEAYFKKLVALP